VRGDLSEVPREEAAAYVAGLSTRARLDQFARDFQFPFSASPLTLGDAMDFLTHKDYSDNWPAETQEQFCGLEFADWKALLTDVGFTLDPASHTSRNDWIIEHRIAPVASLTQPDGRPLAWPDTHVLLVARRPLNS